MKIAVLANCQGETIAACARNMIPGLHVDFINEMDVWNGTHPASQIVADYDLIFSQKFFRGHAPAGSESKICYFPVIAFNGYHPDMTYLRACPKGKSEVEAISGPMFTYHSAIAIYSYLRGKSVEDALEMFTPQVFSRLGYYDVWAAAKADLLAEGVAVGMPLTAAFEAWTATGSFMYSFNHPKLNVLADLTRKIFEQVGLEVVSWNAEESLQDPMKNMPVWPVYPSLAERVGMRGDYAFKLPHGTLLLPRLINETYAELDKFELSTIDPLNFSPADFDEKLVAPAAQPTEIKAKNPYSTVPKVQFWRNSVASVNAAELDPVVAPRFAIRPTEKLATAGSCFAQHIARTLARSGFNYYVPESAPAGMGEEEARAKNFGTYSARFGNIYTVRQLLQLIQRAEGAFTPDDVFWTRPDGRLVDPYRPQIEPDGFADLPALVESRERHLDAVRTMIRDMEFFVFTLGLTEGWRSKYDGAVFPLAPGVAGGEVNPERYEFINFSIQEIEADLFSVIDMLQVINPKCRIILTVSPVPLIATFEHKHALTATTYSKAVLRTAADLARQAYAHVEYFPSFEIITGSYNRGAYFEDDLREVKPEGVTHVMGVFMRRYTSNGENVPANDSAEDLIAVPEKKKSLFDIVCDEEAIARF
ncbi:GSCFA family protein [Sphingomonas sp. YR710]|uniref:GSCFA domain-containing protein n=1 Tax=Sphingomonas sp. YR710 TaxID=1882773 RepID=UPI00087F8A3E|nr:GSCFA domain-containing protein [Sphingomonas sp. YR710]SDC07024.1 GSCFA family protein [Sphingomonas sp. YR710]